MKEYVEFFGNRKEPLVGEQRYFWVTIHDFEPIFGNAMAVAESVVPSMDELFFSRKGHQLGFRVVGDADKSIAAVVWVDNKTKECFPVLMTDGQEIITSDPCFIPIGQDGLCIGINDHRAKLTEFSGSKFSWLASAQELVKETFSGDLTICSGIRMEEMHQRLRRKINRGFVKKSRDYF